jgi:hypothetical protein
MDGAEASEFGRDESAELFDVKKFMFALGMKEEDDWQDEEMMNEQDDMDEELREYGREGDYGDDEDHNLVHSIIKGYEASGGAAGPMSNLLSQLKRK